MTIAERIIAYFTWICIGLYMLGTFILAVLPVVLVILLGLAVITSPIWGLVLWLV